MLLVGGATGRTGTEVLRALRDAGLDVRGLCHQESGREPVRALGAEPVVADLGDPKTLEPALAGVTRALLIAPSSPMQAEYEQVFIECAKVAGVAHVVKLSMLGASPGSPLRFAKAHGIAEQALRASGMKWTLLRASSFMQNTLAWPAHVHDGVLHAPVPDAPFSPVDTRDVAEVAVAALTGDGHEDRAYALTGPAAVSYRTQARILFGAAGREVEVREVPLQALKQALVRGGAPAWNAEGLGELLESYAAGHATTVATGVQDALGRPPRTLEAFARDHRGAFTVHEDESAA
jgi:uncharacterized protein YbjT (DUF2867 family)